MRMIIRLAQLADIPAILHLLAEIVPVMNSEGNMQWDSTYPNREVFENDILKEQLWVAEMEGKIGGFAAITTDQEPEYGEVGWDLTETAVVTHRLAVGLGFRGRGVARGLLQKAEEVARERGIAILRIDTNTKNTATNRLFPKLGYEFSGEIGLGFRPNLRFFCYQRRLT